MWTLLLFQVNFEVLHDSNAIRLFFMRWRYFGFFQGELTQVAFQQKIEYTSLNLRLSFCNPQG